MSGSGRGFDRRAVFAFEEFFGDVDGSGKSDSLALPQQNCIDPDHLTIQVEERTARVPQVHGGIDLEQRGITGAGNCSPLCADNPNHE